MLQLHKARKSVGRLFCQQRRWTSYWSVVSGLLHGCPYRNCNERK